MEQFLDLQREIMEQYIASRHGRLAISGPNGSAPAHLAQAPEAQPVPDVAQPPAFPLLGEIVRHDPGREIVMRRRLDLSEDRYGADHTLGGRNVSHVDRDQHGLPVMPMTFSLEMMAELAALLVPDQVVVGLKGIRLLRWLPFDEEDPPTVEATARVAPPEAPNGSGVGDGPRLVQVEIRDLGNTKRPGDSRRVAVQGTVVFGDHYPEPPAADEFPLSGERPCRVSPEMLYRNLFHGPLFQGVCSTDRLGEEGIEGHVRVLPRSGLFRSVPDPELVMDPVLTDVAMHLLGCWHLEQPDQTGRILLPFELAKIEIFGPMPAVGTRLKCRGRTEQASARHFRHGVEAIGPDGRLWCRLSGASYWRFYLPWGHVNFFGPKDEYFLSREWPLPSRAAGEAKREIRAARPESAESVPLGAEQLSLARCMRLEPPVDLQQVVMREATARVTMSRAELHQFHRMKGTDQKLSDWLFGRIAAKDAIRVLWRERHGERLFPADIEIEADPHGRPVARRRGSSVPEQFPAISIAHTEGLMAALATFGPYVGLDVERIKPRGTGFEEIAFDAAERTLLDSSGPARDEWTTRFWCAKEAIAKALGRGLVEGPRSLSVCGLDLETGAVRVTLGPALAAAAPEFRAAVLIARTVREHDLVAATTFCEWEPA